jgi:acetyl esterase/lipase
MVESASERRPVRHFYGSDGSQFGDLYLPASRRRRGTVVLMHGGWWGPRYGADNLDGAAADLAERGWPVWNVEYRRLGIGGGYPATLEDVAAAIDHLAVLDLETEPVLVVGHSAGGHLAAWAAGRRKLAQGAPGANPAVEIAGVVSLAGVLDLASAARQKLGNGAAIDFMGGTPDEVPPRYGVADPLLQVPIPAMVRCVHTRADDRVPFSQSVTYVAAAQASRQDALLVEVDGDHFSIADATSPTWPAVVRLLGELVEAGSAGREIRPSST